MLKVTLILPLMLFILQSANAATVIEILSDDGSVMKIMSNGKMARVNHSDDSGYTLVDYKKQTVRVVVPQEKQVMDFSGDLPSMGGAKAKKVNFKFSAQGDGPKIVGYATKKYKILANGKNCGTVYGSMDAMKAAGISRMFDAMQIMMEKQTASMGGFANRLDDCQRADMHMNPGKIGIPMRSNDESGNLTSEVKRIDTGAKLPAGTFSIPKGYRIVSVAQQMRQAQQRMQGMPDMGQMMQQMQGSGQMSPEAMEQMQQMQEKMQQ